MMQKIAPWGIALAGVCLAVGGFLVGDANGASRSESQMTGYDYPGQSECNLSDAGGMISVYPRSVVDHVDRGVTYYLADKGCTNGEIAGFNRSTTKADVPMRGCRTTRDLLGNIDVAAETCADVDPKN